MALGGICVLVGASAQEFVGGDVSAEARARAFAREHIPELIGDLDQLRREDPEAYRGEIGNVHRFMNLYQTTWLHAPERAEQLLTIQRLEHRSLQLAKEIHGSPDAKEKERLSGDLRQLLA